MKEICPLPVWGSLILFGFPTLLMWLATRFGISVLKPHLAGPDILSWFFAGGSVFFVLFLATLVALRIEQGESWRANFAKRLRFRRINPADVGWSLAALLVCGLLSAGIAGFWGWASQTWQSLPAPEASLPFIHMEPVTPDTFWVLLAWLPLFFFNIAGEELWWRGYILPRQEQEHGSASTLVHGFGLAVPRSIGDRLDNHSRAVSFFAAVDRATTQESVDGIHRSRPIERVRLPGGCIWIGIAWRTEEVCNGLR